MPVSVHSYECCPFVVGWCWCCAIHNATIVKLGKTNGTVQNQECLCPLLISSERPLGWGWEPPCTVFSTLVCFLNERCESQHSPRNFVDSSNGRSVFPVLTMGDFWARDRGAVKCMTLHLWATNLKPFLVVHSCMAFTACCKCIYGVQRASSKTDCQVIDKEHERVCRMWWTLTLTYIFEVIRPWLRKSCPLCSVYSSGWNLFILSTNDHYH